jgi:hypothetical protein
MHRGIDSKHRKPLAYEFPYPDPSTIPDPSEPHQRCCVASTPEATVLSDFEEPPPTRLSAGTIVNPRCRPVLRSFAAAASSERSPETCPPSCTTIIESRSYIPRQRSKCIPGVAQSQRRFDHLYGLNAGVALGTAPV